KVLVKLMSDVDGVEDIIDAGELVGEIDGSGVDIRGVGLDNVVLDGRRSIVGRDGGDENER
ncbi:hypothetical protein, partial [Paenibacillus xylanexedens]|uniref:hypothetical protein n=1 Tax=Paenibacillus xylanexedens TaxID=528191 RepID=UPI001C930D81